MIPQAEYPQSGISILSDARWIGPHGIGRFASEVLARLPQHTQLTSGPRPLSLMDPLWLSSQIMARRPSVFFSPGFNAPAVCRAPLVLTIHDLTHIQMPFFATPMRRLYYQLLLRPASRRAYRVVTVSEYSRTQIIKWSGLPEQCVVNVGNGVGPAFHPAGARCQPGFPYVLYVGCHRPHKNLARLFEAFRDLRRRDIHIVLTGVPSPEVTAKIRQLEIAGRVHFIGCVADADLPALYRGALLLVLPSLMEGFGLPALEAMACGTPVVVSKAAALPEVVGDAGLLVDPLESGDIARGMEWLLEDCSLRRRMREAGLGRARLFSWNSVAARVSGVLEEAAMANRVGELRARML